MRRLIYLGLLSQVSAHGGGFVYVYHLVLVSNAQRDVYTYSARHSEATVLGHTPAIRQQNAARLASSCRLGIPESAFQLPFDYRTSPSLVSSHRARAACPFWTSPRAGVLQTIGAWNTGLESRVHPCLDASTFVIEIRANYATTSFFPCWLSLAGQHIRLSLL